MTTSRPITIVGGGLAGLSLGVALRQREIPVTLYEAGSYPRHRVCGEFICGRGIDVLHALGLYQKFVAAGAVEARSAAFCTNGRHYRPKELPRTALCLSRHTMDRLLAEEFQRLGGELLQRERFSGSQFSAGVVRATGRRIETHPKRIKWIGLKAHALGATLGADLEMHFIRGGYVGLCRLAGGVVNVSGLFAVTGPVPQLASRWQEFLRGPVGSALHERLQGAEFIEESFCAVSGLDLRPAQAEKAPECRVGDALTMIPPVTGNGMSMAFESAAWAAEPLAAYSRGESSWDESRLAIARRCDAAFARRLRYARWLQWLLLHRGSRGVLLALGERCDWLWRAWFQKTR
ncbi:MAG: FAD-dependent monooxygenase [Verrucomicrobiae bacterium]|nr:FAD-dependent monooxygenase [Verrucomicrobiae bacterium]